MIVDLLKELNELDEHPTLEAKSCAGDSLGISFFETVCSFSNEPGLGGGRIVLGVTKSEQDLFGGYEVCGVGKGKGSATYYVSGPELPPSGESGHGTLEFKHGTLAQRHGTLTRSHGTLAADLPAELAARVAALGLRPGPKIRPLIIELCTWRELSAIQLADLLGRSDSKALKRDHLGPMVDSRQLEHTHPDMERHPQQAYRTTKSLQRQVAE